MYLGVYNSMVMRTSDPMCSNEPAPSNFARKRVGLMAAATFAGAALVLCGLILLLVTYLGGADFSKDFFYATLFAVGGLSGLTALGSSFVAQNDTGTEPRRSRTGGERRPANYKAAASAFLAIAYLCIIGVAISAWGLNR